MPSAAGYPTGAWDKPERPLQGGQIRTADVGSGSASVGRARDLTAGKLNPKLSDRIDAMWD
jgi:hypothetical protein